MMGSLLGAESEALAEGGGGEPSPGAGEDGEPSDDEHVVIGSGFIDGGEVVQEFVACSRMGSVRKMKKVTCNNSRLDTYV
jgi:hypothetical protein